MNRTLLTTLSLALGFFTACWMPLAASAASHGSKARPSYSALSHYTPPSYAPGHRAPSYQSPSYRPHSYTPPSYHTPAYVAPSCQRGGYCPPAYTAPSHQPAPEPTLPPAPGSLPPGPDRD